ncbi:acetyltransferase [Roseibium sp. RKSG952]|nr:acetyltransferase [Roseibium sp. RKSG952]
MEIWRAAVDLTHDFLAADDRQNIERMLAGFLPGAPLMLAVNESDEAMAFMLLEKGHMEALFVHPDSRGSGVGRFLVNHALGLHPALTTDVNEQNSQAVGFYRHMGFEPTGRSPEDGEGRPYPLVHLRYAAGER